MFVFALAPIVVGVFSGTLLASMTFMFQVATAHSLSLISEEFLEALL